MKQQTGAGATSVPHHLATAIAAITDAMKQGLEKGITVHDDGTLSIYDPRCLEHIVFANAEEAIAYMSGTELTRSEIYKAIRIRKNVADLDGQIESLKGFRAQASEGKHVPHVAIVLECCNGGSTGSTKGNTIR